MHALHAQRTAREEPELSIVIPSRNGEERLPETLASIAADAESVAVEVIVVDDGSTDRTADVASRARLPSGPPRVFRRDGPPGRAAACNLGVQHARGGTVLILDDDMTVEPGTLAAHRDRHRAARREAALGRIRLARPPGRPTCFRRFLEREQAFRERSLLEHAEDVPFHLCLTGHFSAPRAVLLEASGFDETIRRYGLEDIEFAYRLAGDGVRLRYLPAAVTTHRAHATTLDRYLARHIEVGRVARQLARVHPEGPFRDYLRVDPPSRLGIGSDPAGLALLRLAHRLLLHRAARRLLGSSAGFAAFRLVLRALEAARLDRAAHFGYHVAADLRYFQGYFGEKDASTA